MNQLYDSFLDLQRGMGIYMAIKINEMTLAEFIQNPSGLGSAMFYRRDLIIKNFKEKFKKLYLKKKKDFTFKIYELPNEKDYIYHITIPSEKYTLKYDICFEFILKNPDEPGSLLNSYNVKFFSNSPGFTFTYAYVLNKKGMLIEILKSKINDKALNIPPVVRNPEMVLGFEKSAYIASLYLVDQSLYKKATIELNKEVFDPKKLLGSIPSDIEKLREYSISKRKIKEKESGDIKKRRSRSKDNDLDTKKTATEKRLKTQKLGQEKADKLKRKVDRRIKKVAKVRSTKVSRSKIKYSKTGKTLKKK